MTLVGSYTWELTETESRLAEDGRLFSGRLTPAVMDRVARDPAPELASVPMFHVITPLRLLATPWEGVIVDARKPAGQHVHARHSRGGRWTIIADNDAIGDRAAIEHRVRAGGQRDGYVGGGRTDQ